MRDFSGTEPLVGEVVGLRTFRVDESGLLLPLYSTLAWYDGPNTASCAPPTGEPERVDHSVPALDCECGFYAYGAHAGQHRGMKYVQAVVSCWGGVVAGTQGFRAEHARIDAIWLHRNVPPWLRRRVAARYPSVAFYSDRQAMLTEHPLSVLDCYEAAAPTRLLQRGAAVAVAAAVLAAGLLPATVLHRAGPLWVGWLLITSAVAAMTVWLLVGTHSPGHRAGALLCVGVLAWLLAPLFGVTGWVLRLPVLRGLLVAGGGYLLSLRPGFFPLVRTRREKGFCGVSP